MISFADWEKLEIKMGEVTEAEAVPGSTKLVRLQVDFGSEQRQIVAGIAEFYQPDELVGKKCPFLFNLEPKKLKGIESQGMILAVDPKGDRSDCALLEADKEVEPGAKIS